MADVSLPKPVRSGCYPYNAEGMQEYAGAVTAAKDAEIARLRAEMNLQPCGHPESLLLKSAETSEPLYCEACDDKSGRRDAEARETELMAANKALRAEVAGLREDHDALLQFAKHVRRYGDTGIASMAIAVLAARKGDA